MKKLIILLVMVLCNVLHAQIPSINPTLKSSAPLEIPLETAVKLRDDTLKKSIDFQDYPLIKKQLRAIWGFAPIEYQFKRAEEVYKRKLNITDYSFYIDRYNIQLQQYRENIDDLKKEREKASDLNEIGRYTDSINFKKEKIRFAKEYIDNLVKEKNSLIRFFPSCYNRYRDDFFSEFFSQKNAHTSYLNSLSLIFGSATVQSELVSDLAGPLRIAFGSVINADSDDDGNNDNPAARADATEEGGSDQQEGQDDLKRLMNGGGNFYLQVQLPAHAYSGTSLLELTSVNAILASDVEGVGEDVEASNFKGALNLSSYLAFVTDNKKFNFFINADCELITGSDNFRSDFGLRKVFDKPAFLGKAIIGVNLDNKVTFTLTTKSISNYHSLRSENVLIGVQLLK